MVSTLNIVISGLGLRVLNELKATIEKIIPVNTQINWVNITTPNIDILMINEVFFDVPGIQNLLLNKNIRVLKIAINVGRNGSIVGDILSLPLNQNTTALKKWFAQTLFSQDASSFEPSIPHINKKLDSLEVADLSKDIQQILTEIQNPRNGRIKIFDSQGILALIDPSREHVWCDHNRLSQSTDMTINYTQVAMNDHFVFEHAAYEDMKIWLWNILWHSPSFLVLVSASSCFILDYWPQPSSKQDRRDILRMSACFAQGAKIQQVAEYLDLSEDRVCQFVASSLGAGLGKIITEEEATYQVDKKIKNEEAGLMRKLFGGLRRRFGF